MESTAQNVTPVLQISGLVKVYDSGLRAVDGLDLAVQPGEIFALLGPNGAGKTTTIKMIVTLSRPTAGTVLVGGIDAELEPDKVRRLIGYVGQDVAVDRSLTGYENLQLQASLYHIPPRLQDGRIRQVLDLVELSDRAGDCAKTYSGGMKKRLDIACGLIHRPRLLVLDEPTLGLDIQTRTRIWDYIRQMRAAGTTVLLTTHYMEEADRLCDRIAIIDHGKIQALGTSHELKSRVGGDVVSVVLPPEDRGRLSAEVVPMLRSLDFVRDVTGSDDLLVYVEPGQQSLPKVFEALASKGLKIQELSYSRPTLDDVFLKFTGHSMRD